VSADVEVARVPLSESALAALASDRTLAEPILTGGEDYEILCAVPPARVGAFQSAAGAAGVPVTEIGRIVEGDAPPRFLSAGGEPLAFTRAGYSHF
jgi:thiamine-monophosphate kinase